MSNIQIITKVKLLASDTHTKKDQLHLGSESLSPRNAFKTTQQLSYFWYGNATN